MGLTEHQFDLPLRYAERRRRLPEGKTSTKSLSNRSFTRIARTSNSFENMSSLTGVF